MKNNNFLSRFLDMIYYQDTREKVLIILRLLLGSTDIALGMKIIRN